LRENQLLYSSHLPLGVPNGPVINHAQGPLAVFLAPLPGIEEEEEAPSSTRHHWGGSRRLLRGEFFAHTSFTLLLLCFTLFIFTCIVFFIKNQKKLESFVVVFSLL
jgi:hypothetical protein